MAGGSGADEDMMRGNTLAVVVANRHHEELSQLVDVERIYFATAGPCGGHSRGHRALSTFSAPAGTRRVGGGGGRVNMDRRLLLCTDLDRTLLPNGPQPESPGARMRFARLAARPEVTLVYVTGRHRKLVEKVIGLYRLPLPDFRDHRRGHQTLRI